MLGKLKFDEQGEMRTVRGGGPYKKFRDGEPSRNWGYFFTVRVAALELITLPYLSVITQRYW